MTKKSLRIWYWVVLIIFSLANLFSGVSGFFPNEQTMQVLVLLQMPYYLLVFISVAKVLGVIALLQTKWRTIKEWAYAGFTFDFLAASISFAVVGAGVVAIIFPLIFLAVMVVSYWLWKKTAT